jgi:hypothetical protein
MKFRLNVIFLLDVPTEDYDFSTHDTEQTAEEFMLEIERENIMENGIAEYVTDVACAFPVELWTLEPVVDENDAAPTTVDE